MNDQLTNLGDCLVHHGPANDRAYLLKLDGDPAEAAANLKNLADLCGYTKIIAKVPEAAVEVFDEAGFHPEAAIPGYYRGEEDLHFMVRYLDPQRRQSCDADQVAKVLAAAQEKTPQDSAPEEGPVFRPAGPGDVGQMAEVYKEVFASYPFPIHDPQYLEQTMAENVAYFGVWEDGRPIALASAEMDLQAQSAEMTDFATLPVCRGRGFATRLLTTMEEEMPRHGIRTLYTIARAVSFGMNFAFARCGYHYGGTLTQNTQISGRLECMNIWYKPAL